MKVLLGWYPDESEIALVRSALPANCEIVLPDHEPRFSRFEVSLSDISKPLRDADVFITWVVPAGAIDIAEQLKMLAWMHTGIDILPLAQLRSNNVRLSNISGGNAIAVVEHAMMLMLGISKRVIDLQRSAIEAELRPLWDPLYSTSMLENKTLLVIGLGNIGAEIARRAKAFDMHVMGVRNDPSRPCKHVDSVHSRQELLELLPSADYIMLASPLTAETYNMIGEAEIAAMKSTAYVINIGRGHLVDELPMFKALRDGGIAGFASDVWWNYPNGNPCTYHFPIPSRTGLHKLPNVLATSDQAANVIEVKNIEIEMALESVVAFTKDEQIPRELNIDLGY